MARRTAAVLAALALASCHPAAPPPPRKPAVLTEQWQTVPIESLFTCTDRLACLVAGSGPDRPTTVTIKKVSFARIRADERCMPSPMPPGLTAANISFESYASLTLAWDGPVACPAFATPTVSAKTDEAWRRGDARYSFEARNGFQYAYLPLGSTYNGGKRNIRCVVVFDSTVPSFVAPPEDLRVAAETCVVLFYFRVREVLTPW